MALEALNQKLSNVDLHEIKLQNLSKAVCKTGCLYIYLISMRVGMTTMIIATETI